MASKAATKPRKQRKTSTKAKKRRVQVSGRVKPKRSEASAVSQPLASNKCRISEVELLDLERSGLPFTISLNPFIQSTHDYDRDRIEGKVCVLGFMWPKGICEIAETALLRGYTLFMPCRFDYIATVAAILANQLTGPIHVWFNDKHEVLIIKISEEDQVQEDEEQD